MIISLKYIFLNYPSASFPGMKVSFHYTNVTSKSPLISLNSTWFYHHRTWNLCSDATFVFAYPYSSPSFGLTSHSQAVSFKPGKCSQERGNVGGWGRDPPIAPLKAEELKHEFRSYQTPEKPHTSEPPGAMTSQWEAFQLDLAPEEMSHERVPHPGVLFHVLSLVSNKGVSSPYSIRTQLKSPSA